MAWSRDPMTNTEPRVQQLVIGLYFERDIGSQDLASAGLSVFISTCAIYSKLWRYFLLKTE